MKTKLNIQKCSNCNEDNPIYNLECEKCNAILRNRIVNIDLWSTLAKIIEQPVQTLKSIIIAENKNFVILLTFLIGIKFYLTSQLLILSLGSTSLFYFKTLLFEIITFFIIVAISAFAAKTILIKNKPTTRFVDNFALISYSYIPLIIGLIILTPMEIAVFGLAYFTFDPSPFLVNPSLAYLFVGLELLLVIWSIALLIISFYIQSGNKIFSSISGILFFLFHLVTSYYTIKFFNLF
jgi:hypothetical protein